MSTVLSGDSVAHTNVTAAASTEQVDVGVAGNTRLTSLVVSLLGILLTGLLGSLFVQRPLLRRHSA